MNIRRHRGVLLLGLALVATVGCSAAGPSSPGPGANGSRAREHAMSDLERRVLADGRVTRAEYEEAVRAYVSCAGSRGMTVTLVPVRGGFYTFESTDFSDATDSQCSRGTRDLIEPRYLDTLPIEPPA